MTRQPLTASLETVRRLTVAEQHLPGAVPARATTAAILRVIRDPAYVRWDPIAVVAPPHLLSLWSRIGPLRPSDRERLPRREKTVFEHWTPFASLVLTEG
jgi:uncharacterized protein YcaQ